MKNLLLAFLVFGCVTVQAQRKVQKQIDYNNELVEIEFPLASHIELRTWDKASIVVEASAETEDPEDAEAFNVEIDKSGSNIRIASNTKKMFGVDDKAGRAMHNEGDFDFNYVVYVPEGVQLNVSSVLGNLTSEFLKGDISIGLVTGDIDIEEFEGDLQLKSITGKIRLPVKKASFKAKTLMGQIYANEDSAVKKNDEFIGQEMSLNSPKSRDQLSLETITGNIYLQ